PAPAGAGELRFAFELDWPRSAWWLWPYSAAYPFAALCLFAARSNREARHLIVGIWIASAAGFAAMLVWPAKAMLLPPMSADGMLATINRALDADWLACPSFHVAWSLLAAHVYAGRWPRLGVVAYAAAVVIAASCIATGAHALIDVVMGVVLAAMAASWD